MKLRSIPLLQALYINKTLTKREREEQYTKELRNHTTHTKKERTHQIYSFGRKCSITNIKDVLERDAAV